MATWIANKISPYAKGPHRGEEYAFQTVYNRILHGGAKGTKKKLPNGGARPVGFIRGVPTPKHLPQGMGKRRRHRQGGRRKKGAATNKRGGILWKLAEQGAKVVKGLHDIISHQDKLAYDPITKMMVPRGAGSVYGYRV